MSTTTSLTLREQQIKKLSDFNNNFKVEEKKSSVFSFLIENLNTNVSLLSSDININKDESILINKLEGLNYKFHNEVDKYNKSKFEYEKYIENLFINLINQTICYSDEIESLSKWKNEKIISEKKSNQDKINEVIYNKYI